MRAFSAFPAATVKKYVFTESERTECPDVEARARFLAGICQPQGHDEKLYSSGFKVKHLQTIGRPVLRQKWEELREYNKIVNELSQHLDADDANFEWR